MRRIIIDLLGLLAVVICAACTGIIMLADLIGRAQTVVDLGDHNSVVVELVDWLVKKPAWLPSLLAIFLVVAIVVSRLHTDRQVLAEVRAANETVRNLSPAGVHSAASEHNTDANALNILFSEDAKYIEDSSGGLRTRIINIGIRNVGNGWLTNCAVEVVSIVPEPEIESRIKTIQGGFDLLKGMERSIPIAQFNVVESDAPAFTTARFVNVGIFFSVPGGWNGGDWTELSPSRNYTVRLKATASGSLPCVKDLRIWVEPGRVLKAAFAV